VAKLGACFIALHLFIYPSSNAYNSYQDSDEGSIGLIKTPLKTSKNLFYITILFDFIGLLLLFLSVYWKGFLLFALYILASRLYSWRGLRLKQYPILGFLTVFVFQGAVIYLALLLSFGHGITEYEVKMAITSSFLFGGAYPLTQIYQHESDKKDGVKTISMTLGINGTFIFSGALFLIGFIGLIYCNNFKQFSTNWYYSLVYVLPVLIYFIYWQVLCMKDKSAANFKNTMKAIVLSAICMNLMMITLLLLKLNN